MESLSVLGFQFKIDLDCNNKDEFLIMSDEFNLQLSHMMEIIEEKNPNVIILPEMCYQGKMKNYFEELSRNKLIVAGSIYKDGLNYTIVFSKGEMFYIKKRYASGAEPMIRYIDNCSSKNFMDNYLDEHIFEINDNKIVILNCMEYYKMAYYIARNCSDLFGAICICSNNNVKVFLEETRAIHNHVENFYTFMVNSVNTYRGFDYATGESYVYGPIQGHEKEWLIKEGIKLDNHVSSILKLGNDAEYFYGEFLSDFSRFGRSDGYFNNPKGIEVGMLRKKVLK